MLEWAGKTVGTAFGGVLRRRAGLSEEVRRVVTELRAFLNDLTSAGGFGASDFLSDEAKRHEQDLADLIPRLRDRKLRRVCEEVLEQYRRAWASSPPGRERVEVAEEREPIPVGVTNPHVGAQVNRQVEAAHAGLDAIQRVLDRLNRLERWLTPTR